MSPPVLVLSGAARCLWCVMTCDARFVQEKESSALGAPCVCIVTTRSRTNESYSIYTVCGTARPRDVEDYSSTGNPTCFSSLLLVDSAYVDVGDGRWASIVVVV